MAQSAHVIAFKTAMVKAASAVSVPPVAAPSTGSKAGFFRSLNRQGARAVNWVGRNPKKSLLGAGAALGTYAAYRGTRGVIDSIRGNKDD